MPHVLPIFNIKKRFLSEKHFCYRRRHCRHKHTKSRRRESWKLFQNSENMKIARVKRVIGFHYILKWFIYVRELKQTRAIQFSLWRWQCWSFCYYRWMQMLIMREWDYERSTNNNLFFLFLVGWFSVSLFRILYHLKAFFYCNYEFFGWIKFTF